MVFALQYKILILIFDAYGIDGLKNSSLKFEHVYDFHSHTNQSWKVEGNESFRFTLGKTNTLLLPYFVNQTWPNINKHLNEIHYDSNFEIWISKIFNFSFEFLIDIEIYRNNSSWLSSN